MNNKRLRELTEVVFVWINKSCINLTSLSYNLLSLFHLSHLLEGGSLSRFVSYLLIQLTHKCDTKKSVKHSIEISS